MSEARDVVRPETESLRRNNFKGEGKKVILNPMRYPIRYSVFYILILKYSKRLTSLKKLLICSNIANTRGPYSYSIDAKYEEESIALNFFRSCFPINMCRALTPQYYVVVTSQSWCCFAVIVWMWLCILWMNIGAPNEPPAWIFIRNRASVKDYGLVTCKNINPHYGICK